MDDIISEPDAGQVLDGVTLSDMNCNDQRAGAS